MSIKLPSEVTFIGDVFTTVKVNVLNLEFSKFSGRLSLRESFKSLKEGRGSGSKVLEKA